MICLKILTVLLLFSFFTTAVKATTDEGSTKELFINQKKTITLKQPAQKLNFILETNITDEMKEVKTEIVALKQQISQLINLISTTTAAAAPADKPVCKPKSTTTDLTPKQPIAGYPKDCSTILTNDKQQDGVYLLYSQPDDDNPVGAYCKRFEGKVWTTIQRRHGGTVDFNRTWTDYKIGFGDPNAEYWLGLDRIHALTSKSSYELMVEMETYAGIKSYARYKRFWIADENADYRLAVGGAFCGNAKERLIDSNGAKFSTFDKDNDELLESNCAKEHGAWWYYSCNGPNPNGKHQNEDSLQNMFWNANEKLKFIQMAISE